MPRTDELWGGSVLSVSFDPVAWTLLFGVEVVYSEERNRYELVLRGVTGWHVSRDVPLPWNYAELTEVHITELEDGVVVEMKLWDDNTSLMARCSGIRVGQLS